MAKSLEDSRAQVPHREPPRSRRRWIVNIPEVCYAWQRPYVAAALETNSQQLHEKIKEAQREIWRRLTDGTAVDACEKAAAADALRALTTMTNERLRFDLDAQKRSA
jgi:hypothetical protein